MDIDLLSRMVKELILDRDEVTLPGVGTFVTELVPSVFSDKGYTIHPPYRRLYFRQRENGGDTALAELYASSNGISREEAERILIPFLAALKEVLQEKKTIIFPELGRLRATRENNFFFVPDEDLDIYPAGFGLEPISLKTHEETPEEVSQALDGFKSIMEAEAPVAEAAGLAAAAVAAAEPETPVEAMATPEAAAETPTEPLAPETRKEDYTAPDSAPQQVPAVESPAAQEVELPLEPDEVEARLAAQADSWPASTEEAPAEQPAAEETPAEQPAVEEIPAEQPVVAEEAPAEIADIQEDTEDIPEAATGSHTGKTLLLILLVLVILALIALIAFLVANQLAPDFVKSILYSPEELEILRQFGR